MYLQGDLKGKAQFRIFERTAKNGFNTVKAIQQGIAVEMHGTSSLAEVGVTAEKAFQGFDKCSIVTGIVSSKEDQAFPGRSLPIHPDHQDRRAGDRYPGVQKNAVFLPRRGDARSPEPVVPRGKTAVLLAGILRCARYHRNTVEERQLPPFPCNIRICTRSRREKILFSLSRSSGTAPSVSCKGSKAVTRRGSLKTSRSASRAEVHRVHAFPIGKVGNRYGDNRIQREKLQR